MSWRYSEEEVRKALDGAPTVSSAASALGMTLSWLQKRVEKVPELRALYLSVASKGFRATRNGKYTDEELLAALGSESQQAAALAVGCSVAALRHAVMTRPHLAPLWPALTERGKRGRIRKPAERTPPARPVSLLLPKVEPTRLPVLDPVRNRERYVREKIRARQSGAPGPFELFPAYTCAECPMAPGCVQAFTRGSLNGECAEAARG